METKTDIETKTETAETKTENGKAAVQLPKSIALKVVYTALPQRFLYYRDGGSVVYGEANVLNPLVKIEVERAKMNNNYFHLRFSHSNRYWQANATRTVIVAESTEPIEDLSNPKCTLFEAVSSGGELTFTHVQSGYSFILSVSTNSLNMIPTGSGAPLEVTDYSELVKLPPRIAFRGYNDKYLRAVTQDRWYPYHKFESDDPNETASGYEVQEMNDGHVRIKSDHWGKFWRRSPNWIWGDSDDTTGANRDTLFWPVRIDESTIALRNAGNNNFCIALTTEGKVDCLNAGSSTITNPARLTVQELVLDRMIYNVRYRMEDSRIFDEMPYLAGSSSVANNSDQEASMSVEIEYQDQVSYTFSNSLSITAGVATKFQTGVPLIVQGEVEVSLHINSTLQWDKTTTTTKTVKATGSVPVPPRSVAMVSFVGTMGTCSVPFSYTQQDRSSTDGRVTETDQMDGVYTGVNCYNFKFVVQALRSL